MAKRQQPDLDLDIRKYAVIGAEQRLLQIAAEAAGIFRHFPELRDRGFMAKRSGGGGGHLPDPLAQRGGGGTAAAEGLEQEDEQRQGRRPRRRRKMSADARRRISEAQKARWARQKGESAGAGGGKKK